jgi:DNA polymerase-3 subunit epsilon
LLSLDFETTGLDFDKDRVIEYGLVAWDVELRQPVRLMGNLVKPERNFTQEEWAAAEAVHHIGMGTVNRYGMPEHIALAILLTWYETADYIVAHNGVFFDKPMLERWATRYPELKMPKRPWIDTRVDLPVPLSGKLVYLAADHGFINPFPHRALFDAMTCLRIIDNYDVPTVIERSRLPNVLVQGLVSYEDREKAKARGYGWQDYRGKKCWVRTLKDPEVGREQAEAPFKVVVLEVQKPC